jgi:hypothetical protein
MQTSNPDSGPATAPPGAPARARGGAPVTSGEKYATAAYLVVLAVVLLYVVLYAFKLARLEREVTELLTRSSNEGGDQEDSARAV